MSTVRALLEEAAGVLERSGIAFGHGTANALDEAAWLLVHTLGIASSELQAHFDDAVSPTRSRAFHALLRKRITTRKPAAYLLQEAWLGPHRFHVDERVIVPRSFLFELLPVAGLAPGRILDLCTGSGCLAILAALAYPKANVDAADLSEEALAVAARNVRYYKLQRRVKLVRSDLFTELHGRGYDFILSNPPYVNAASMQKLPHEFRAEPRMALASGADGLDHTRAILAGARAHLNPGGLLMVEIGHNRSALRKAYPKLAFRWPRVAAGTGFVFSLRREDLPA